MNTDNNVGKITQLSVGLTDRQCHCAIAWNVCLSALYGSWTSKSQELACTGVTLHLKCLFVGSIWKSNVQKPRVSLYQRHSSLEMFVRWLYMEVERPKAKG